MPSPVRWTNSPQEWRWWRLLATQRVFCWENLGTLELSFGCAKLLVDCCRFSRQTWGQMSLNIRSLKAVLAGFSWIFDVLLRNFMQNAEVSNLHLRSLECCFANASVRLPKSPWQHKISWSVTFFPHLGVILGFLNGLPLSTETKTNYQRCQQPISNTHITKSHFLFFLRFSIRFLIGFLAFAEVFIGQFAQFDANSDGKVQVSELGSMADSIVRAVDGLESKDHKVSFFFGTWSLLFFLGSFFLFLFSFFFFLNLLLLSCVQTSD